jgi:hypothetical protein
MPIPQKKDNESQNDYMGRCMHKLKDEERPQNQKVAICLNTYRNPKKKAKAEVEIDFTEDIKNMNKPQEIIPIEAPEVKTKENTASCGKPNCGSVQELKTELITLNDMLDKLKDSDLLNIRDQILGSLNQLKSLLKLV